MIHEFLRKTHCSAALIIKVFEWNKTWCRLEYFFLYSLIFFVSSLETFTSGVCERVRAPADMMSLLLTTPLQQQQPEKNVIDNFQVSSRRMTRSQEQTKKKKMKEKKKHNKKLHMRRNPTGWRIVVKLRIRTILLGLSLFLFGFSNTLGQMPPYK